MVICESPMALEELLLEDGGAEADLFVHSTSIKSAILRILNSDDRKNNFNFVRNK